MIANSQNIRTDCNTIVYPKHVSFLYCLLQCNEIAELIRSICIACCLRVVISTI